MRNTLFTILLILYSGTAFSQFKDRLTYRRLLILKVTVGRAGYDDIWEFRPDQEYDAND